MEVSVPSTGQRPQRGQTPRIHLLGGFVFSGILRNEESATMSDPVLNKNRTTVRVSSFEISIENEDNEPLPKCCCGSGRGSGGISLNDPRIQAIIKGFMSQMNGGPLEEGAALTPEQVDNLK